MTDGEAAQESRREKIRWGRVIRVGVVAAAVAFLIVFSILNRDDVTIDYAFGDTDAPMILVIVISAAAGFIIGVVAGRSRSKR